MIVVLGHTLDKNKLMHLFSFKTDLLVFGVLIEAKVISS